MSFSNLLKPNSLSLFANELQTEQEITPPKLVIDEGIMKFYNLIKYQGNSLELPPPSDRAFAMDSAVNGFVVERRDGDLRLYFNYSTTWKIPPNTTGEIRVRLNIRNFRTGQNITIPTPLGQFPDPTEVFQKYTVPFVNDDYYLVISGQVMYYIDQTIYPDFCRAGDSLNIWARVFNYTDKTIVAGYYKSFPEEEEFTYGNAFEF